MAWEATHLLPPVLLVLLVPGSWEQKPVQEVRQELEGGTISVTCKYRPEDSNRMKIWCRQTSAWCNVLVTSSRRQAVAQESRYSIWDYPRSGYFTVGMTKLRKEDSGSYWCGILEAPSRPNINIYKIIQLVVSPASTPSTTRSTVRTTAWASAISPVINSPPDNWKFIIPATVVALLLLLALTIGVILYIRKAREGAEKDDNETHYIYEDISDQKEKTTDFNQHVGSEENTDDIRYASLIHFGPEDHIYANSYPNPRPTPDPFLSVDYASITGNRPQPSKSTALEGDPKN
ncbi:trem-like transcript 4 protein [Choloepus didactylus]|uniref:trem-like transcript 4 protein n=1 Tax=Choloepus didactylus TaxID=27675 RepID=UPI00189D868B|nr:trem-like transcript 4 protein [Choloepus didactylus]